MAGLKPRVHVHTDVNPPQNPKGLLQNADVLVWQAEIGGEPATLIYDNGGWRNATPQEMAEYVPPEPAAAPTPAPTPTPTPTPTPGPALGGVGAGTTRASIEGTTAAAGRERARAKREGEMQSAMAVGQAQEQAAAAGPYGGLTLQERSRAEKLRREENLTEEQAASRVKAERQQQAGAQASALEGGQ